MWGLAFKPDTDDMRNAPAIEIIQTLQNEGAKIKAYDPQAIKKAKEILSGVEFCRDAYGASRGCDCLLILTQWKEFKEMNFPKIHAAMRQPIIFDGRNLLDQDHLSSLGFEYFGIGRGTHRL